MIAVKMTKNHSGLQACQITLSGTFEKATIAATSAATGRRPHGAGARNTLTMKTTMRVNFTRGSMRCRGDCAL